MKKKNNLENVKSVIFVEVHLMIRKIKRRFATTVILRVNIEVVLITNVI